MMWVRGLGGTVDAESRKAKLGGLDNVANLTRCRPKDQRNPRFESRRPRKVSGLLARSILKSTGKEWIMANSLCQLAQDWRGDIPAGGVMVEEKRDGWRGLWLTGIDGIARLFTRNGHLIEGAGHIAYRLGLMERAAGEALFIDGEYQVDGSLVATKAWCEGGWRRGGEAGTFHLFDCLTMAEWRAGGTDTPLYVRKARLAALAKAVDEDEGLAWEWRAGSRGDEAWRTSCPILPDQWAFTAGDVIEEARRVWAAGGEGIVLKSAEAPYRRNRNAAWLKVKRANYQYWRKAA